MRTKPIDHTVATPMNVDPPRFVETYTQVNFGMDSSASSDVANHDAIDIATNEIGCSKGL